MQDIIAQIVTYLRGMWRYRWPALALAWFVAIGGWIVVANLPDEYESSARIHADTDSLLRPLLRGLTVSTDLQQRLQLMTQTLLTRPNMERVARMTDLDLTAKTPEDMETLLERLSQTIKLSTTRKQDLYSISYRHDDPEVAKRVVQSLLTILVESALGEKRDDSDSAQRFIDQQIAEYEARLLAAEEQLKEFKRQYAPFMGD